MIGFAYDVVVEELLVPQDDPLLGERRVYFDAEARPVDVEPQEWDARAITSTPLAYEIGDGVELRHTIAVALDVQHGDPVEARRIRDLILVDLILRLRDRATAIKSRIDPSTGQYVTRVDWSADYAPLGTSDTNESAVITFTVDTQLDG